MSWQVNQKPTATNTVVTLNGTTFTTLLSANRDRIFLSVTNPTVYDIYVNLCATADGVTGTGIWIPAGSGLMLDANAMYTGEICAISATGTPSVAVCEF